MSARFMKCRELSLNRKAKPFPSAKPVPIASRSWWMKFGAEVSRGAEGELCIAGPSVLQGYWDLPENTAKAFLPGRQMRWYRTGDIVRELADDNYKFLRQTRPHDQKARVSHRAG